jgi:hypothetical protein
MYLPAFTIATVLRRTESQGIARCWLTWHCMVCSGLFWSVPVWHAMGQKELGGAQRAAGGRGYIRLVKREKAREKKRKRSVTMRHVMLSGLANIDLIQSYLLL